MGDFVWILLAKGAPFGSMLWGEVGCGALGLFSLLAIPVAVFMLRTGATAAELEKELDDDQQELRFRRALLDESLEARRKLYREDVAGFVEHYNADSRKYRRVHNSLQSVIMAGSALTTAISALDTGRQLTWQSGSLTGISFAITLAAAFTGYYKYRERAYFAQQTADAIEEEINAFTLGVGDYSDFKEGEELAALARFARRVEVHRNEQRRRQQQLDQPAEQTPPAQRGALGSGGG